LAGFQVIMYGRFWVITEVDWVDFGVGDRADAQLRGRREVWPRISKIVASPMHPPRLVVGLGLGSADLKSGCRVRTGNFRFARYPGPCGNLTEV
jgi:hypothetical protein